MIPAASRIRREAAIPTAVGWQITEPQQAEEAIRDQHADLVMLAREMLRDPYWPYHAALELGDEKAASMLPVQYAAGRKAQVIRKTQESFMPVHDRSSFESLYAGQPRWEIGRPQQAILDVADRITGSVLDAGCGTGENALFFASRGQKVTGIDFLAEPINRAKQKAAERGLTATFLVMDALALKELPEVFDSARSTAACSTSSATTTAAATSRGWRRC